MPGDQPGLSAPGTTWLRLGTRRAVLGVLALAALGAGGACQDDHNVMAPASDEAERLADIGWVMFGTAAAICLFFLAVLAWGLLRRRRPTDVDGEPRVGERTWILAGGVALPLVVIGVLTALTLTALAEPDSEEPLIIEATGHQFWWEVRYPELGISTANEFHVPVGRPVRVELHSDDVIHSFWLPKLSGKIDMIPGHTTHLEFEADRPGVYRGQCAEFCGIQHAQMIFFVTADEPGAFEEWVALMRAPAPEPDTELEALGLAAFLRLPCAACHTIQGTPADGTLGPELTHFARREHIGAGAVPNTLGNLAGWIPNSQTIKPGNLMPPIPVSPEELEALIAYLESLE